MTRILLLSHAPLASAMLAVAQHVFPDCAPGVIALDVDPADTPDQVDDKLRHHLDGLFAGEPVLILVDAFGASPCNAAVRVADGQRVRVVAGLNVPMLWRTLCYCEESLPELVERATAGGAQGVMPVSAPGQQHQSTAPACPANDQVQHRHQQ